MSVTSAETYEQIEAEGLLSATRWIVYKWLYHHGPATAREVFAGTGLHTHHSARFNELEALGVATSTRTRICTVTGREAKEWKLTDALPGKLELQARARRPNKRELGAALAELRLLLRLSREAGRPDNEDLVKTACWLVQLARSKR